MDKALKSVEKNISSTQRSLKDVERLLKLDPTNVELLAQKQRLLQKEIEQTSEKLDALKSADEQAKKQLDSGDLGQDKYDALQREIIATESKLKSLESQAAGTESGVKSSAEKIKESFQSIDESVENVGKKLDLSNAMDAVDTLSSAGEKVIDFAGKTVSAFTDVQGAITKVNGYFGLTGDEAKKTGDVVTQVFKSGVTDSLDTVADAVIVVKNNLKDLDPSQLERISEQAIILEQVFGSDMNETMRGVNSLMVNFGLDAQTAMDYVVKGTQNGLDKTQELGDNLSEYAGKFSQAGYSAQEYFQLLQNGLEGGAYNLDKVNDSINEVTTRLADGTIGDAIGQFSDKTQEVFDSWKNGGASQKDVINSIIEDIKNASSQQDALSKASVAFGTMGEDANMGVVTSLTTLGDTYKDVSGAAQSMADSTTTPMQELQASLNELTTELAPIGSELLKLATQILPPVVSFITKLIEGFMGLPGPVKTFIAILGGLVALFAVLAPAITAAIAVVGLLGSALGPVIAVILGVAAVITAIITVIKNWGSITEWVEGVISGAGDSIKETWNNVRKSVGDAINNLVSSIENGFNSAKNFILSVGNSIRSSVSDAFNSAKTAATNAVNSLKSGAIAGFNSLVSGIRSAISGVAGIIKSGFQGAISYITSLPGNAFRWGADFINGLKNGILSGITGIVNAVKGIGDKIKSFLHFSRPDVGPLRDYETWMPDMMKGLAKGIYDYMPILEKAAAAVSRTINYEIMKDSPAAGIDYNRMYDAVRSGASDSSTVLYIGERPFKRQLKGMGVVFS